MSTTATQVDAVVLTDTRLEHLAQPVGVGIIEETINAVLSLGVTTRQWRHRIVGSLTQIVTVLSRIHYVVDTLLNLVYTKVALIVDLQRLVFLTALRCDDHHTVSSTRTVDSTCRSVLQHLNGFDVIRREVADRRTHGYTINHIQRSLVTIQRTNTTDTNRRIGTWLTVRSDRHTSHLTFEHRGDVGVRHALQFIGIHDRHGTRQVGLLLNTVTHDDHLLKHHSVALHLDLLNNGSTTDSDLAILVTHITHDKCAVSRSVDREVTVIVGNHTRLCVLYLYGRTNEGFSVLIHNLTTNLDGLVLLH